MRASLETSNKPGCTIRFFNLPLNKSEYKKFTVLRDPINRFVSGVYEDIKRSESSAEIQKLRKISDPKQLILSFLDYIDKNGFTELHTAPQHLYFYNVEGSEYDFDRVLIFERLRKDFDDMCKEYDINYKLEHKQVGDKNKASSALNVINNNPEIKERIEILYKKDFELYNKYKNKTK